MCFAARGGNEILERRTKSAEPIRVTQNTRQESEPLTSRILWKESTRPEGRKNPLPTMAAQEVVTTHVMGMSMHCSLVLECLWSHGARTPRLIVLPSSFSAMVNQQACEINEIVFLRMEIQHKTSRSSHRRTEIQHKTYPGQNLSPGHVDLI